MCAREEDPILPMRRVVQAALAAFNAAFKQLPELLLLLQHATLLPLPFPRFPSIQNLIFPPRPTHPFPARKYICLGLVPKGVQMVLPVFEMTEL